jgi:gamma-glutamylcyclotransferase (GGCT)/AIG2-like uncharacterized protein YtfP
VANLDAIRLFVCDSLMQGERDHALLQSAKFVGVLRTAPLYALVEAGPYAALVEGGSVSVVGELYVVDRNQRLEIDVKRECPVLFQRIVVTLEDGTNAEAYAMSEAQVRGKRRIKHGSFRDRFAPRSGGHVPR